MLMQIFRPSAVSIALTGCVMLALAACQTTPVAMKTMTPAEKQANAAAFAAIVGSWKGTWGSWKGTPRITSTLTVTGESPETMGVKYCTDDKCWPTPSVTFQDGALSWNNRGWRFKFTPQDDGTLKGTLTTSQGINSVTKSRI